MGAGTSTGTGSTGTGPSTTVTATTTAVAAAHVGWEHQRRYALPRGCGRPRSPVVTHTAAATAMRPMHLVAAAVAAVCPPLATAATARVGVRVGVGVGVCLTNQLWR